MFVFNKQSRLHKHLYKKLEHIRSSNIHKYFKSINVPGDGLCGFHSFLTAKHNNIYISDKKAVLGLCAELRKFIENGHYTKYEAYEGQIQDMLKRIDSRNISKLEIDILHALSILFNTTVCVYYDTWKENEWIILNPLSSMKNKDVIYLRQTGNHYLVLKPLVKVI